MLNILNRKNDLTREKRVDILQRALHSVPFFTRLDFPIITETVKRGQSATNVQVNRDYWLTELMGNFGEVFTISASLFDLTVWTDVQKSLYGYESQSLLPSGLIATEARFKTVIADQIYDDRQYEFEPIKILRNNRIYAQIRNQTPKTSPAQAILVTKGFYVLPEESLQSSFEVDEINKTLDQESDFEYFRIPIDKQGFEVYTLENDRTPRLILGWGVTNSTGTKADVSTVTVQIESATRRLQMMDVPIPIEFIAPRLTCLLDQYIYYLPVEYYLQPFERLQFRVTNTSPDPEAPATCNLAVLTRTV